MYARAAAINLNNGTAAPGAYAYAGPLRVIGLPGAARAAVLGVAGRDRLYATWLPPAYTGALSPFAPILTYKAGGPTL